MPIFSRVSVNCASASRWLINFAKDRWQLWQGVHINIRAKLLYPHFIVGCQLPAWTRAVHVRGRGSTSANIAILSTRPFTIMATSCCLLEDFINYSASLKRPPLTPYPLQQKKYKTISSQKVKAEMLKRNVAAKWQPSVFICQCVPGLGWGGGKAGPGSVLPIITHRQILS